MRARRQSRGQAMLLAVVGMLILAIGMYTSYNLSRAVYEKIQLQNAADATAYSLATIEARTFNFIAFANRSQVANYVQMLEAQSLLSSATFVEGLTGWGGDFALSVGDMLEKLSMIPGLGGLESIAQTLKAIGRALEQLYDSVVRPAVNNMDTWQPKFIQMKTAENQALFAVSALMIMTTGLQIADGAFHITEANDPDARRTWVSFLLNAINAVSYATALDTASMSMRGNSEDTEKAKRLMVEMVHASRYGTQPASPEELIVARGPFEMLETLLGVVQAGMAMGGREGRRARRYLSGFVDALERLLPNYIGTAKLLTPGGSGFPDVDDTGQQSADHSAFALGDTLVAKDTVRRRAISFFPKWHKSGGDVFASVISTPDDGLHCRYDKDEVRSYGTWRRMLPSASSFPKPRLWSGEEFKCERDSEHRVSHEWKALVGKGGIQPYIKFAPKESGVAAERVSFNQPDVWVFLNKEPEAMALAGNKDLDFEIGQGTRSAELDARIGEGGFLELGVGKGMNVFARAQVYYHRPGAWNEPPNFFNPYWGARLAPTNAVIKRLGNELGLPGLISQIIGDNIWTH